VRRVRAAALFGAALLASAPAFAFRPTSAGRSDAKRFGFDRVSPPRLRAPSESAKRAFAAFNAGAGGRWKMRFSGRTGLPSSIYGGRGVARPGRPQDAARSFLTSNQGMLGLDPSALTETRVVRGNGHEHVLYRQKYRGIPVEFTAVKVHMAADGSVLGLDSTYEPLSGVATTPSVSATDAARAAVTDAGAGAQVREAPTLAIVPVETTGADRLSWKMRVDGKGGGWRYYVDAITGQVLFRYQIDRFLSVCASSGVVSASIYSIDPSSTAPSVTPFNDQYVFVGKTPTRVTTANDPFYGDGFFCSPAPGKVTMSLQGPYVSVSEFRGPSAHYDNGSGVWATYATPVSSPHPYPNSSVLVSTINLESALPNAVEFLPVFSTFKVGDYTGSALEGGDITDDDQLFVYDGYDDPVAAYLGNRGNFRGAAVHGRVMHLVLKSNSSGQNNGYDISISSYLTLSSPDTNGASGSSHTWTSADTSVNLHGEFSLFYHLNKMHDYFLAGVDKSSAVVLSKPVVAMAHAGPDLINAFYDPDQDDFMFGDLNTSAPSDIFADDATVPHHEYVHYITEKIWSIQNFGQAGAISEANADYFAASSLDDSAIGRYVCTQLNSGTPCVLREIDDAAPAGKFYNLADTSCGTSGHGPCWSGEIHDDSPFYSQALWDIRKYAISTLGYANGKACADGLEFQTLLFFPESFGEAYQAMLQVDKMGAVAACGGANAMQSEITNAFNAHGIAPASGDGYEPDDGFGSAVDISTLGAVSATIYPGADSDFYSFGAGAGLVQLTLSLPSIGSGLYEAYQIKLFDRSRHQVAAAEPPYNGFGTLDGVCDTSDCQTTASQVVLRYNNPSGGLLYAEVVGGTAQNYSNSFVHSTIPYALSVSYPQAGALSGGIVNASFDADQIGFTVNVSTFVSNQDWRFAYAQLRNQSLEAMPNTVTHQAHVSGDWLDLVSSDSAHGYLTGSVKLVPGFAARFPSVGTVYLEVFGYDVHGSTSSLGLSNPINLTATAPALAAYNNIFNPMTGGKATVRYATDGPGRLTVKLYTVTGELVSTLYDGPVSGGKGSLDWSGRNMRGSVVASGVYVVRAVGPGLNKTQKIVIVK
jgi:Zn-dependent metalloprotease